MAETQVAHVPMAQAPAAKGLGVTALVFGISTVSIIALAVILSVWSIASGDTGWMMLTALLVVPAGGLLSFLLGLVAVILAIVLAIRTKGQNKRWIPALALGMVGAVLIPGFFLAVNLFSY